MGVPARPGFRDSSSEKMLDADVAAEAGPWRPRVWFQEPRAWRSLQKPRAAFQGICPGWAHPPSKGLLLATSPGWGGWVLLRLCGRKGRAQWAWASQGQGRAPPRRPPGAAGRVSRRVPGLEWGRRDFAPGSGSPGGAQEPPSGPGPRLPWCGSPRARHHCILHSSYPVCLPGGGGGGAGGGPSGSCPTSSSPGLGSLA